MPDESIIDEVEETSPLEVKITNPTKDKSSPFTESIDDPEYDDLTQSDKEIEEFEQSDN